MIPEGSQEQVRGVSAGGGVATVVATGLWDIYLCERARICINGCHWRPAAHGQHQASRLQGLDDADRHDLADRDPEIGRGWRLSNQSWTPVCSDRILAQNAGGEVSDALCPGRPRLLGSPSSVRSGMRRHDITPSQDRAGDLQRVRMTS